MRQGNSHAYTEADANTDPNAHADSNPQAYTYAHTCASRGDTSDSYTDADAHA